MTMSQSLSKQSGSTQARVLEELVEEITTKLQAGEPVSLEAYADGHPEFAGQLRELLPALQVLAELGSGDAGGSEVARTPQPAPEWQFGTLGDFRLLREVGRGGMGVVYEAEQISLNRRVALKVLPFAGALDAKQLQRFKNEAQAAAGLHHTNIVPVHAVGCERGVHYYAMQFIDGRTLAAVIAELRVLAGQDQSRPEPSSELSAAAEALVRGQTAPERRSASNDQPTVASPAPDGQGAAETVMQVVTSTGRSVRNPAYFGAVARLGVQAAEALEHAHQLGVIHRDVKPGNLLVDGRGNLWVTDFGLAHCQSQVGLTMTGDLVGTLRYMSPEQALAKRVVDRPPHGYLLAGGNAVRVVDAGAGLCGERPRGVAAANRFRGAEAAAEVQQGDPGGPGNDRAEGAGQEPGRALRHRPGGGRRPAPLPGIQADPGPAADASAARAEVGEAAPESVLVRGLRSSPGSLTGRG
jgi:serine/threonine-protein kinase